MAKLVSPPLSAVATAIASKICMKWGMRYVYSYHQDSTLASETCVQLRHSAFGAVFVARHCQANDDDEWKELAVKKFIPNDLDTQRGTRRERKTPEELELYCQEIKSLQRLHEASPSMSRVLYMYEFLMPGLDYYLVTELLGQSLDEWRQRIGFFTENIAIAIDICFLTILKGISYIHSRNVVHRNMKMQNILFQTTGVFRSLKLAGFGLSRV